MKKIFITGTAGFIGFHLAKKLLEQGYIVHGFDCISDYYDVTLKEKRHEILSEFDSFSYTVEHLENFNKLHKTVDGFSPQIIIHLAAQAGVRHSLENPKKYIDSNVIGTFNLLEVVKKQNLDHLLMASTSSVYGSNKEMPFKETQKCDTQLSMYAATKKANEVMAHSYAYTDNIPITMFRFFTVYGTWGRPDLALFKFVDAILDNRPIDIYNNGEMYRDFTHVNDLISSIIGLIEKVPHKDKPIIGDSLSDVAPFRIVNIGRSEKIHLMDFIEEIETVLNKKAIKNFMPMQMGDVSSTWADISLAENLTGTKPSISYKQGIKEFVEWFRNYYQK